MSERPNRQVALRDTVRLRILALALLPILILLPLFLFSTVKYWSSRYDEVLIDKVGNDLTIADQHLQGLLSARLAGIESLAGSVDFHTRLNTDQMQTFLASERDRLRLDFLYFVTDDGTKIPSEGHGVPARPELWPVVEAAVSGQAMSGIDVFESATLSALSPELARQATIELLPTKGAAPTERETETRGMVVHAAAPAYGGALVGGVLLNRNLSFIDEINDLVYPVGSLTGGGNGTATIFLDDVRVSTNVRMFQGERAIGTRVSQEVRDRVLGQGVTWVARAFVVSDWYVSSYEPIVDSFGERIGMLYVGFLEAPFRATKRTTLLMIWASFLLVLLVSVPVLLAFARGIFKPLEQMNRTITRIEEGDLSARSDIRGRDDEISRLAFQLDQLLEQLEERDRHLREWNERLEERVAERTRDLEEAKEQIAKTTKQLILSEKRAAVGEITAGVAHEINNPLAVIQGNLDVIRYELGDEIAPFETEFRLIDEQILKVNALVSKLLGLTRDDPLPETAQIVVPDDIIRESLPLLRHMLDRADIVLTLDLVGAGAVEMAASDLEQVIVNLVTNAVHALPDGGKIEIQSHCGPDVYSVTVSDTGVGIDKALLTRIFDPFVSTKGAGGTGLGLAIIRDIISRAGGDISVTSEQGRGARFTFVLPLAT